MHAGDGQDQVGGTGGLDEGGGANRAGAADAPSGAEIDGQHRLPAAPERVWQALADRRTVENCLPDGAVLGPDGPDGVPGFLAVPGFSSALSAERLTSPAEALFRLRPDANDGRRVGGTLHATLTPDDLFTSVTWRWRGTGDALDAATVRAAVDGFLARIGQHAAVPVTIAADGLSGVATTVAASASFSRPNPLAPVLATVAAWPREVAIGGALFALVFLIVVGIV